ncbi:YpmS family protein [Robertmurraya sp. DFI.2.37]|nr:YpmS family protein [Robertmurraya sp. DFI.2.37]
MGVTQMEVKSKFKVKVQSFDLKNDQITFRIKVPNKTLGL